MNKKDKKIIKKMIIGNNPRMFLSVILVINLVLDHLLLNSFQQT